MKVKSVKHTHLKKQSISMENPVSFSIENTSSADVIAITVAFIFI